MASTRRRRWQRCRPTSSPTIPSDAACTLHVETIMHDGGTGGFRTFAAVAPSTGTAVVVLGSSARSVTRLGADLVQALTAA